MSGLSIKPPIYEKTRGCGRNLQLVFADRFLEPLAGGESGNGLGRDLDLLTVHRAATGPRLALARQEGAEADQGDALAFRHVVHDRLEYRVHHFVGRDLADISGFSRDLD